MRFTRTIALVGVGLLWLAFGPLVLLLAAGSLYFRRVRDWLRPTRRVVAAWVLAVAALAGLAVVVPDGWLPIPPGPGALVSPAYVGRPTLGFRGEPRDRSVSRRSVKTKSYGVDGCRRIDVDAHDRLVSLCGSAAEPVLRADRPREPAPARGQGPADPQGRRVRGRLRASTATARWSPPTTSGCWWSPPRTATASPT